MLLTEELKNMPNTETNVEYTKLWCMRWYGVDGKGDEVWMEKGTRYGWRRELGIDGEGDDNGEI